MHLILILVHSITTLIVGPTTTTSSKMLRTMAATSASIAICLISLEIGFAVIAVLSMVLLGCASLISPILKLTLTILRYLASVLLCETSKLSVTALTSKRSMALTLTWGIVIIFMIIVVRALICIGFICLLGYELFNFGLFLLIYHMT